jgi:hypothetical protein
MRNLYIILAVVTLAIMTTFQPVMANGNYTMSDKKAALTILVQQITRDAIQELRLNEMQYIRLKDLNKNYRLDIENLKALTVVNPTSYDVKATELTNTYFSALSEILTQQQISAYLTKQPHAQNN